MHAQDQQANRLLINKRQKVSESNHAYFRRFQENVITWELSKGKHAFYTQSDTGVPYEKATKEQKKASKEKYLGMLLIQRACISRYGRRIDEFEERDAKGIDEYPTTVAAAFDTLTSWELLHARRRGSHYTNNNGRAANISFLQMSDLIVEEDGNTFVHGVNAQGNKVDLKRHITCSRCGKKGHYSDKCPERDGVLQSSEETTTEQGTTLIHVGTSCAQNRNEIIPKNYIIIDSASTNSCFMNEDLVMNIEKVNDQDHLELISTGGTTKFKEMATCKLIPMKVWLNRSKLANILSLKEVASIKGVEVTLDTSVTNAILVHMPGGIIVPFKQYKDGLFAFDTLADKIIDHKTKEEVANYSFVTTVQQNKSYFTRDQIKRADRARILQQYIGWPSIKSYKDYITKNLIKNTDITVEDINRGEFIYGAQIPLIQGKMTKKSAVTPIQQQHLLALSLPILENHSKVNLCVDFFFVNGLSFLHTISRNIHFRSVSRTRSRSAREHSRHLSTVINKYEIRGFEVVQIEGDNEFDNETVRTTIAPRHLMIAGRDEHVGPVERSIRTIKERARCTCHALPYKRYTTIMIQSLIENVVYWLNNFPAEDGISDHLSPAAIVEGRPPPNYAMKKILYGSAAIVFAGTNNNMSNSVTGKR